MTQKSCQKKCSDKAASSSDTAELAVYAKSRERRGLMKVTLVDKARHSRKWMLSNRRESCIIKLIIGKKYSFLERKCFYEYRLH